MTAQTQPTDTGRLLFIVLARGGSKRLPDKNIKPLCGKSLLERTQTAIAESDVAAPCLLSTDDPRIAEAGRTLGWMVPFLRPAELADDHSSSELSVLHAIDWYAREHGRDPLLIMLLQPTSPMRRGEHISQALALLESNNTADAVLSVKTIHVGMKHIFTRRPDGFLEKPFGNNAGEIAYVPNGAIYLVRTKALRQTDSLTPPATLPLEMDEIASLDIDTKDDWRLAETVLATEHSKSAHIPAT